MNSNWFCQIKSVINDAMNPKTSIVGIKFEKYLLDQNLFG